VEAWSGDNNILRACRCGDAITLTPLVRRRGDAITLIPCRCGDIITLFGCCCIVGFIIWAALDFLGGDSRLSNSQFPVSSFSKFMSRELVSVSDDSSLSDTSFWEEFADNSSNAEGCLH
jgi:hypothetical protein